MPMELYEAIAGAAAGKSIGGWCRQAIEAALKGGPAEPATNETGPVNPDLGRLELDKLTLERVTQAAIARGITVAEWVRGALDMALTEEKRVVAAGPEQPTQEIVAQQPPQKKIVWSQGQRVK